jgi:multidrug resistance efflux pump
MEETDTMATTVEPEVREERESRGRPAAGGEGEGRKMPERRRRIVLSVLGLALLALIAGGVRKIIWSQSHVSSDDAQVDGHILPVLPKVGGFVQDVRVEDNQPVHAGDTLIVLDDRDYRVRLQQADADLAMAIANAGSRQRVGQADAAVQQAESNARKAHADLDRLSPLAAQGIVSSQQLDGAQAAVRSADAALAAAEAALRGAIRPRCSSPIRGSWPPPPASSARRTSRWASWCSRGSRSWPSCRSTTSG